MLTRIVAVVAIVAAIASCSPSRNDEKHVESLEFYGRVYISNDTLYYIGDGAISDKELHSLEALFEDYTLIIGTEF